MQVYGVILVIVALGIAYTLGLHTANRYHAKADRDMNRALERQYACLRANVDFFDTGRPYVGPPVGEPTHAEEVREIPLRPQRTYRLSKEFETGFMENGSATVKCGKNPVKNPTK